MKINPLLRWRPHLSAIDKWLHQVPFLAVGGVARVALRLFNNITVTKHQLTFAHLPRAFHGLTITHLTDIHLGPLFTNHLHLPPLLAACRELDSDLICCTGDWVDYGLDTLPEALRQFEGLRPDLGWFGVLGNHDMNVSRSKFLKILRPWLGNRLLINNQETLTVGGESLNVSGLDFSYGGSRLRRNLSVLKQNSVETAVFRVGLMHHPDNFDALQRVHPVDLALGGHTHGGQICWTAAPAPAMGPATFRFKYPRGHYQIDKSHLYVGCGVGSSVPLRINCPPEVAQFTLLRGETLGRKVTSPSVDRSRQSTLAAP